MEFNLSIEDIMLEAKKYGVILDEQKAALFIKYYLLLLQENRRYNLTRIINAENVFEEHFFDPLLVFHRAQESSGEDLLDLGSGAGFPGIPLKIFLPDLKLTIVDASQKKINFLRLLTSELKLKGIILLHKRAEELGRGQGREYYSWVTARAVSSLPAVAELALPLLKIGGYFWAFKGPSAFRELDHAQEIIGRCGAKHVETISYDLPRSNKKRVVLIFKKHCKADEIFPRRPGLPQKRPLEKK